MSDALDFELTKADIAEMEPTLLAAHVAKLQQSRQSLRDQRDRVAENAEEQRAQLRAMNEQLVANAARETRKDRALVQFALRILEADAWGGSNEAI